MTFRVGMRLFTAGALLVLVLAAGAAYLEPGDAERGLPRPPPPSRPPIERPEPGHVLSRWLDGAEVMAPVGKGMLRIHPVRTRRVSSKSYLTLDEGIRRGLVVVSETGSGGTVNRLSVENRSGRTLALLAGEIVAGGKQDRTVEADLLLPRHSGPTPIGVFCVEQRRWAGTTTHLLPQTFFALPRTRRSIAGGASQADVWDEVAELQGDLGVRSRTGALRDVYEDPEIAAETEGLVRGIAWRGSPNGMIVYGNGRLMGADLFGGPALFAEYRDKLLRAYAAQALSYQDHRDEPGGSRRDPERFLRRIRSCRLTPRTTPGVGENSRLSGAADGEMLRDLGCDDAFGIVHVAAYPASAFGDRPPYPVPTRPRGRMEPRGR